MSDAETEKAREAAEKKREEAEANRVKEFAGLSGRLKTEVARATEVANLKDDAEKAKADAEKAKADAETAAASAKAAADNLAPRMLAIGVLLLGVAAAAAQHSILAADFPLLDRPSAELLRELWWERVLMLAVHWSGVAVVALVAAGVWSLSYARGWVGIGLLFAGFALPLLAGFWLGCQRPVFSTEPGVAVDAGFDAGIDAGVDAGFDAGVDAGFDVGVDASTS